MQNEAGKVKTFPRILLISSLFAPEVGGVCTVAESLAEELHENVVVVAPKKPALPKGYCDWKAYDKRFTFHVHRTGEFNFELPKGLPPKLRGPLQFAINFVWTRRRVLRSIHKLLASNSFDLICVNTLGEYWLLNAMKRSQPTLKFIFYIHGEEVAPGSIVRRLQNLQRKAIQEADAVVAVSSFTAELLQQVGVSEQSTFVVNNGVDIERFSPGPKDLAILQRFALADKRVLLCLARLDERKGQDMLIRAMPLILRQVPNAVLLLVGAGGDQDRLVQLQRALQLEESVIFAGLATDAERLGYYRTADVYAMPNRTLESGDTEGFGLVFLEAGACGKPVVGGRAGGVPDAIVDGETGYLVDGRSTEEIARVCSELLLSPAKMTQLGNRGRIQSLHKTWAQQSQLFLSICRTLCLRKDSGDITL